MAEEITRTVENVDRLFSEIVVNGESHVSNNYVPPVQLGQQNVTNASPAEETQGEDVYGVKLNDILHNLKDQATAQALTSEITARQNADTALQNDINAINSKIPSSASASNQLVDNASLSAVETDVANIQAVIPASATPSNQLADASSVSAVQSSVSDIEDLIPSQASSSNQLADKDFVNSSISTNTANFLGTYTSLADIEAIQNPTNNDYAFLQTTDSAGNNVFDRYKYNGEDDEWLFEYELNNSSFTAQQWATINSGLTQGSVDQDILNAINALDASSVGGNGKYIKSISEANGVISATEETMDTTPTANSTKACTSGGIKSYVDTQVTQAIAQVLATAY